MWNYGVTSIYGLDISTLDTMHGERLAFIETN